MFAEIGRMIEMRVQSEIEPLIDVIYDNTMKIPKNGQTSIRVTNIGGFAQLIGGIAGNGLHRQFGTLIIEVYTPKGEGTRYNDGLCDFVADAFRDYRPGSMRFYSPSKQRVGEERDLYHQNVNIPYQYDKCYSGS